MDNYLPAKPDGSCRLRPDPPSSRSGTYLSVVITLAKLAALDDVAVDIGEIVEVQWRCGRGGRNGSQQERRRVVVIVRESRGNCGAKEYPADADHCEFHMLYLQ